MLILLDAAYLGCLVYAAVPGRRRGRAAGAEVVDGDRGRHSSYRRWAPVYDRTFGALTRAGRRRAVEHVNRRGGSVLEVGVGTGLARQLRPHLAVTGIDYSAEMLARAQAKVTALKLRSRGAAPDGCALARLPRRYIRHGRRDDVLSVVPEPERVVAEMARVCRPGGEVLVLNHFMHEHGPLGFLGRRLGPLANQLGWHSDFTTEPVMSCDRLELVERRPSPPFGIFTLLRLRKRGPTRLRRFPDRGAGAAGCTVSSG